MQNNIGADVILQEYFGYDAFKPGQEAIIGEILKGRDVLGIMPTGAGKSLCFQVPALVLGGTAVVISPLISLMKDQVDTLCEMGVEAAFLNSSLDQTEFRSITAKARSGAYKLLYIAPERLELESFQGLLAAIDVALVAVDEAHCISQWGHDFRPSYRKISAMIGALPSRPPIAAFTATATPQVREDIIRLLKLQHPYTLVTGFDRENLSFTVDEPVDKFKALSGFIRNNGSGSGIIYCATRKAVESVCAKLNQLEISCTRYHAGLSDSERRANQEAFINDRITIITATNAFGMGIDKSNIRFVLHYNMPKTMENYYQEAGRAGRDGERAQCILLYSPSDIMTNKFFIEQGSDDTARANDYKKLQDIIDYCNTGSCLRQFILNYFGEEHASPSCDNCSNCLNTVNHTDITLEAQNILSCIILMGERFGSGLVIDVLRGSRTARIKELNFEELPTYSLMPQYSKASIKEMISFMIAQGLIDVKGDKYPVLFSTRAAHTWLKSDEKLWIKRLIRQEPPKTAKARKRGAAGGGTTPGSGADWDDNVLFERLRQLRTEIASEQKVPPYIIFSDATLHDMCHKLPTSVATLLDVSGVGQFKLTKYGHRFLQIIKKHAGS